MRVSRAVAVALLGAVVAASAAMAQTTYLKEAAYTTKWPAVELSSSAIFVSMFELTPTDYMGRKNTLMCYDQVDKAKETNSKKIQFVPTIHWKGSDTRVDAYCYRDQYFKCADVTTSLIAEFQSGMQNCIQYAVDKGFTTISMLPHLDNDATYYWRNKAWFNPMEKVKGVTYHDILVAPVAKAMNYVAKNAKGPIHMYLTLQGETGKSIIFGPRYWALSYKLAKAAMTEGLEASRAAIMKVGVSMNHNQICACINFSNIKKDNFVNTYCKEFNSQLSKNNLVFDYAGIQGLYKMADFIGVSSYPAMVLGQSTLDIESPQKMNMVELSGFGVFMQQMIAEGKEVIISETGIGGGDQWGGVEKAVDAVARNPFFGLWSAYAKSADPWSIPANAAYRRELYKLYLSWLAAGTGPRIRIAHVFTWSGGSWDVLGTHYASTTPEGSFRDDVIYNWVAAHNAKVNGASV